MNKINYQLELDREIDEIKKQGRVPSLLLHSCCGPCSSYVLEYLTKYFDVTVLYFNPNIYPAEEYEHRLSEQRRIISLLPAEHNVKMLECEYDHTQFTDAAKGYEQEREGGSRCEKCFYLRLERTAQEEEARLRLFHDHPFRESAQEFADTQPHRRGDGRKIRSAPSARGFQEARGLQALDRALEAV